MKITVGICQADECEYFLENGADEISAGFEFLPSYCAKKSIFGADMSIVRSISDSIHRAGKKIAIYANEIIPAYDTTVKTMHQLHEEAGVDGFIIASDEILKYFPQRNNNPTWILGILGFCFNSKAAKRYRDKGISRIILPQHLKHYETEGIKKIIPELEFYYMLHERCLNIDGICLGCDNNIFKGRFCLRNFSTPNGRISFTSPERKKVLEDFYYMSKICTMLKLVRFGNSELRKLIFTEAKTLLNLAENSNSPEKFITEASYELKEYDKMYNAIRQKNRLPCL